MTKGIEKFHPRAIVVEEIAEVSYLPDDEEFCVIDPNGIIHDYNDEDDSVRVDVFIRLKAPLYAKRVDGKVRLFHTQEEAEKA